MVVAVVVVGVVVFVVVVVIVNVIVVVVVVVFVVVVLVHIGSSAVKAPGQCTEFTEAACVDLSTGYDGCIIFITKSKRVICFCFVVVSMVVCYCSL